MGYAIAKIIDILFGKLLEHIILLHEALELPKEEKKILRDIKGPTFELENNSATDPLIQKLFAAKSTHNRVIITARGVKVGKLIMRYHLL